MPKRLLALTALAVTLAACARIEEQQQLARRQQAETDFVDAVGAGSVRSVRESLEHDRTLANAVRSVSGRRRHRAESALTFALKQGRRDMLDVLFEFGADPNLADATDASPLATALLAADKDRQAMVTLLLEKGAEPERAYRGGSSALHHAAGSSSARDTLALLLAKASGAGGHNASGWTPLHSAAGTANVAAIRLLVAKGADVNVRTTAPRPGEGMSGEVAGATPLAIVASDRQIAAAATLCALGADPDAVDATSASPRQVAARVAAAEAAKANPTRGDLLRHQNMAAFLARGAGCDALFARRRGHKLAEAEVLRIANESECGAGWGWACGQAGWAYYKGEGAKQDAVKALALFRTGCESALTTHAWCCGMAGIIYVEGTAAPKDPGEGARWLARGCETADPKRADEQSCNRLGLLYAEGSGVPRDLARAQTLFKRACDQRYETACANLAQYH